MGLAVVEMEGAHRNGGALRVGQVLGRQGGVRKQGMVAGFVQLSTRFEACACGGQHRGGYLVDAG